MREECIAKSVDVLKQRGSKLKELHAIFGFDGFVDIIVRPVKKGDSLNVEQLYSTISEFSSFLAERSGKSCSIELKEYESKIGGNVPICANTLGSLGTNVTCIGAFGYPDINTVFGKMPESCDLISVENPGITIALEFTDGKIMLAMNKGINSLMWETIESRADVNKIIAKISDCDMLGLFNWSELPEAAEMWKRILARTVPDTKNSKWAIFDFGDCARKSDAELENALNVISDFGKQYKTVLSLNENEARAVCNVLLKQKDIPLERAGAMIFEKLGIHSVVFHLHDRSIAFDTSGISQFETYLIENPTVTTGAGDNFNAGLSAALLLGMGMPDALATASLTASFYVAHGRSPLLPELIEFMEESSKNHKDI